MRRIAYGVAMRYGFYLPTRGQTATPEALEALVQRGEALGFASVMIADHLVFPVTIKSKYPYTVSGAFPGQGDVLDQLSLMAFAAAKTSRLRLVSSVMIVPYRNPVLTASGTFGYGREFEGLTDLRALGSGGVPAALVLLASPTVSAVGTTVLKRDGAGVSSVRVTRDALWIAAALWGVLHLALSRSALGLFIRAIGGNPEAARVAGIRAVLQDAIKAGGSSLRDHRRRWYGVNRAWTSDRSASAAIRLR